MKKLFVVLLLIFISSLSYSQTKSDLAGIWKATVKAGNKPTTPTYMLLNADGTFAAGVDSTGNVIDVNGWKGKWDVTSDNEIKIIIDDSGNGRIYVKNDGNRYMYIFDENGGVRTKVRMLEQSWYLEKVN
jgi:hypothetical protein